MDLPVLSPTENRDHTGLFVWFFNLSIRYVEGRTGDRWLYENFFCVLKSKGVDLSHLQDLVRTQIPELEVRCELPSAREIFFRLCTHYKIEPSLCGWREGMPEVPINTEEVA